MFAATSFPPAGAGEIPVPLASAGEISAPVFAALVLTVSVAALLIAWFYYDWRARRRNDWRAHFATFSCLKCRHLYSLPRQPKVAPCPKCGFTNSHLRF